ncbi:MAG: TRAP transporter substrate-binding protein [Geminicoccaceae bacterium]|nr:TRAP transporter substrate-binding protein [Geminicoccaceae bacterium]MCX7629646.1 TRAP transporter substrate-binding protein [Geminicoccaceae bacterium]MDW8125491.1 TRAP transporter substrate-binding protein [Geminicoccaceae bacterium]MDW8342578.1 TRAP transporter substrate-binding protein [Geminicoccaceae bacterium]
MIDRKGFLVAALSALVLGTGAQTGRAAEVTLTLHHFLGPKAPAQTAFFEPWAKKVEAASKGRIKIEIFPSMSMGGKPAELYTQARDGVADIVWTLVGYTPGAFPRAEVFELPGVHRGSARATTLAIQDLMDRIGADFADTRPILIHCHAGQVIFSVNKPIRALPDLAGLKIRVPSRTGAMLIEAWGAQPVSMPVPELPQALSKGTVDATLIPFEVATPLKIPELVKYATVGAGGARFGTSVFIFTMNKKRYESLPPDLKAVIDQHSGKNIAAEIGRVWDEVEQPGIAAMEKAGGQLIALDAQAQKAFDEKAEAVVQRWIAEAKAKGIDAEALVKAAREAVARHSL